MRMKKRVTVRMTEEQYKALAFLSEKLEIGVATYIRALIQLHLKAKGVRIDG